MNAINQTESAALEGAWMASNPFVSIRPTWETMEQTLRQWHEDSLNDPEFTWMDLSFEDMADKVNKAVFNASVDVNIKPDNGWMARQDGSI